MTSAERENLLKELDQTREALVGSVRGLSEEQLEHLEAPGRWSVAENLEHIAVAEHGMLRMVQHALGEGAASATHGGDWRGQPDGEFRDKVVGSRMFRFEAPERIRPTGRWPLAELVPTFEATRERTRAWVNAAEDDLRCKSIPHPNEKIGRLDCYQWLMLIASHCERHRLQIETVKACPTFPH